jgi:hypothetical protein
MTYLQCCGIVMIYCGSGSTERKKPPCNFTETQPLVYEGKTISNSGLRLSHWTLPIYNF